MCMLWGAGLTRPSGLASYIDLVKNSVVRKNEYVAAIEGYKTFLIPSVKEVTLISIMDLFIMIDLVCIPMQLTIQPSHVNDIHPQPVAFSQLRCTEALNLFARAQPLELKTRVGSSYIMKKWNFGENGKN